MRKLVVLLAALALLLTLAGPAAAKKYKDKDGGTIEVSGQIQYEDTNGNPVGPPRELPPQAVTIHGQPAVPLGDAVEAVRFARSSAASGCANGNAWIKRTQLGFFLWQFWHYVSWCWSYPNVTTISRSWDGRAGNGWAYDGLVGYTPPTYFRWCCLSDRSGHRRMFRGGFHFPVFGGFQSTNYPQIRLEAHGNGTFYYFASY